MAQITEKLSKILAKRRNTFPVDVYDYESDENEVEDLDYHVDSCCVYDHEENPVAPVQVKRPDRSFRRPADRLHLTVWNNDPSQAQKLTLYEGITLGFPPFFWLRDFSAF